eukprot:gene27249-2503_t
MRFLLATLAFCALTSIVTADRSILQAYKNLPMWQRTFPPYQCIKNLDVSPFYLETSYTQMGGKVCFTARTKTPTKVDDCNDMDFYKLELDVALDCVRAVTSYTVNGEERPRPTYSSYGNEKGLIKLTQVNLTVEDADGAEICMQLDKICPSLEALCPAHDGSCNYSIVKSGQCNCCPPYFLSEVIPSKMGNDNVYTFTVDTETPTPGYCASTDLEKIEFWSTLSCHRAVSEAYVNGVKVTPGWDSKAGVWKVTRLGLTERTAPGTTIALRLDAAGPCPTLSTLCNRKSGKCIYSTFNEKRDCCPVGYNLMSNKLD